LTENGTSGPLQITNGAFFTDLQEPQDAAFTIALTVTYTNGSQKTVVLNEPGPLRIPPK
jgi:hypothetical protein